MHWNAGIWGIAHLGCMFRSKTNRGHGRPELLREKWLSRLGKARTCWPLVPLQQTCCFYIASFVVVAFRSVISQAYNLVFC